MCMQTWRSQMYKQLVTLSRFKAGLSGMDDTTPDDIKQKIDEYLTMNEAFSVQNISCS